MIDHAMPTLPTMRIIGRAGLVVSMLTSAMVLAAPAMASDAVDAVIAFDERGEPLDAPARIAYLTECVQNPYCQQRLRGMEAAAEKFGFEFKVFDANFNPAEQLKQAQNSVVERFDGYILAPAAAAPGCGIYNQFLKPTGKPVVTINLPMCDDVDYTEGLAGTVTMQRQGYFDAHVEDAFASCAGACKVAAVGGFLGSDLFNLWQNAIEKASASHPNVDVVVNQPGNFDPRTALRVLQDGFRAHPDISVVISSWDDMTRGVEQAATSVNKTLGEDVRIYSIGATKDAIQKVKEGTYAGTTVLLPFEESYYGAVAMVMALKGEPVNAYVDEQLLPTVVDGPGTILITAENADTFEPRY